MASINENPISPRVCAGIVLYNPAYERLVENISAIVDQVERIIIVDNHSENIAEIQALISDSKIKWIKNKKNIGIAGALNQIVHYAHRLQFEWVVTLDQDSIASRNMIAAQWRALDRYPSAAMITPFIIDINVMTLEEYALMELPDYELVDSCITSGAFTNIQKVLEVGSFHTKLFIDYVDFDVSLRLRKKGYQIVRANNAYILHELGKISATYILPGLFKITGIDWFRRPKRSSNHSPTRVFYQSRNMIYVLKKHGKSVIPHPTKYWLTFCRGMGVRFLLEEQRWRKLGMFLKGTIHGIFFDDF